MLWFLYKLAFLDRTRIGWPWTDEQRSSFAICHHLIGNAKSQGMTNDFNMKDNGYNIALFIFFVYDILFGIPINVGERNSYLMGGIFTLTPMIR